MEEGTELMSLWVLVIKFLINVCTFREVKLNPVLVPESPLGLEMKSHIMPIIIGIPLFQIQHLLPGSQR